MPKSRQQKDWDNKQAQLAKFNLELGKLSESIQEQESILAKQRKENAQADRLIEKSASIIRSFGKTEADRRTKDVLQERTKHTQKARKNIKLH